MKYLKAVESEGIEEGFERFSTEDMLKIFLKSGIKICYDLGISFWYEDLDWFTYDKLTEDEIDSIYNSACVEREVWMKNDLRAEADEAISLVIHSIEALRGDMKAAIIATSKIGIFSQYDIYEWMKKEATTKAAMEFIKDINEKRTQIRRDAGKKSNKYGRNDLIIQIYSKYVKDKNLPNPIGRWIKKGAKDLQNKKYYTDANKQKFLQEIIEMKNERIARIIKTPSTKLSTE